MSQIIYTVEGEVYTMFFLEKEQFWIFMCSSINKSLDQYFFEDIFQTIYLVGRQQFRHLFPLSGSQE